MKLTGSKLQIEIERVDNLDQVMRTYKARLSQRVVLSLALSFFFLFAAIPLIAGEKSSTDPEEAKLGVVFNMANDRKIEKTGGIYEPEGLDKYFSRRMDKMSEQIAGLEKQIGGMKGLLEEVLASHGELLKKVTEKENARK